MTSRWMGALSLGVALLCASGASGAEKAAANSSWENVASVPSGKKIKIDLRDGTAVRGQFLSSDDGGVTVLTKAGTQVVPKKTVQKITRRSHRWTMIGIAVGTGLGGLVMAKSELGRDYNRPGVLAGPGPGKAALQVFGPQAAGAAMGWAIDASQKPIYEDQTSSRPTGR